MRALAASLIMLVSIVLVSSCGDSATEITGTLPIVTGIAIDTIASRGDTIVVTWDALTDLEIDGYFLWFRINAENPWTLANTTVENASVHIADRSAFYTVMAFHGENTSSDIGLSDNTNTIRLPEIVETTLLAPLGFRIDTDGDSLVSGDPTSPDFHQHFTVAFDKLTGERFIFPGAAHPDEWPGGRKTNVSVAHGFVAPAADDTTLWQDSILFNGDFFLLFREGRYCRLNAQEVFPDTLGHPDTLYIEGQFQPQYKLRVFNQTW